MNPYKTHKTRSPWNPVRLTRATRVLGTPFGQSRSEPGFAERGRECPIRRKAAGCFRPRSGSRGPRAVCACSTRVVRSTSRRGGIGYWTLREFESFPGWIGGADARDPKYHTTRHNKGLMTYDGQLKPAWFIVRDRFARRPLYRP